jgi:TPP-dependent pyruvate/acetoin dehydrogenase alpha subunit
MGGHATHDEREARETFPAKLFSAWGKRDPIGQYEAYLKEAGWSGQELEGVEAGVTAEIERAEQEALASREKMPAGETALLGVYANGR